MLKYILKRVLIFISTLIAISLLAFIISINAPGDPVDLMLNSGNNGQGQSTQKLATEQSYLELKHQLGLDLPVFYFSLTSAAFPDTLYRVQKLQQRKALERMCDQYGNWNYISKYYLAARNLDLQLYTLEKTEANALDIQKAKDYTASLLETYEQQKADAIFSHLNYIFITNHSFGPAAVYLEAAKETYLNVLINKNSLRKYVPAIYFYGLKNQYHNWFFGDKPWLSSLPWVNDAGMMFRSKGFLRGDFGMSYQDKRPVSSVLWDAVRWTMLISAISILISYFVAIPIGVRSAVRKGTRSDRIVTTGLFMLYSLPNFWIATMSIMFLCGGDYLNWFPAFGLGSLPDNAPFLSRFVETAYHLILPVICWTYASFAFLSRQMRGGMLNVIGQDFIRTAKAKGLDDKAIIWKHAFRNSLLPIITLFANIFPLIISGSFAIEIIFSIPGMGKITLEALIFRNYPIVFTVMMFSSIMMLVGTLVADVLYAFVDPRISFTKKQS